MTTLDNDVIELTRKHGLKLEVNGSRYTLDATLIDIGTNGHAEPVKRRKRKGRPTMSLRIRRALRGSSMTLTGLADALNVHPRTKLHEHLDTLITEGRVEKTSRDYRLVTKERGA